MTTCSARWPVYEFLAEDVVTPTLVPPPRFICCTLPPDHAGHHVGHMPDGSGPYAFPNDAAAAKKGD